MRPIMAVKPEDHCSATAVFLATPGSGLVLCGGTLEHNCHSCKATVTQAELVQPVFHLPRKWGHVLKECTSEAYSDAENP